MAVNAQETFLSIEQKFSDLVAGKVEFAERVIDERLKKASTPDSLLQGLEIRLEIFLSKADTENLRPDGTKLLVEHVTDGIINLYQEGGWAVCAIDNPKLTSASDECWFQTLIFKYIQ